MNFTETLTQIIRSIGIVSYTGYIALSPFVFAAILILDIDKLKIKFNAVASFVAFLVLFGVVQICLYNGQSVPTSPYKIQMFSLLRVFLEDAYFVMIPFYITNRIQNKKINFAVWLIYSIMFSSCHLYQGLTGVLITSFYPYFISNKFAKKSSFGTVMVCHLLWDFFALNLPKINNLLSMM